MGSLLGDSRLQRTVSESTLEAAELNLLEMEKGLKTIQDQVPALQRQSNGSYVAEFNKTKSILQQAGQDLRDMAENTVAEVRDMTILLEDFDSNNDMDLLKLVFVIMKDLMLETKEKLEAAREKYQSVPPQAFDNIISSVESHMDQAVVGLDCQTAAWKTLDICASVHHYVNENSRVKLEDLKLKSDRFLGNLGIFVEKKQDIIDVAIDLINEKIDQIKTWADSTEDIIKNIEENPAEYLEMYKDLRTVLRNGIN